MAGRSKALSLLHTISSATCSCPAHSGGFLPLSTKAAKLTDYAFEMACSTVRYGPGVTKEIGQDVQALGAKKRYVITNKKVIKIYTFKTVMRNNSSNNRNDTIFKEMVAEEASVVFKKAIDFARAGGFDAYVAVGGGSVMDTCKAANLYASDPEADFLDYVNPPIGKGKPVTCSLSPLIAVPTTAGTGSETTGVAIFDYMPLKAKTGIANRALRPSLGIIDPLHTLLMPERVAAYSGFDVLCHALESFTAIPYNERSPCPEHPLLRPAYQGSNPISDVWALHALRVLAKYFKRSVYDAGDVEARSQMHLASCFAGVGFGNAGVHLCHGMSYPIAGNVKNFHPAEYELPHSVTSRGLAETATLTGIFTTLNCVFMRDHSQSVQLRIQDVPTIIHNSGGLVLADAVRELMVTMKVDNGLDSLGYTTEDIPALVKGTLPQHRVTKLAPREQSEEDLATLFENSMKVY
ncbi:unnamed protein product, partial [Meganyctiphanes norvegica]